LDFVGVETAQRDERELYHIYGGTVCWGAARRMAAAPPVRKDRRRRGAVDPRWLDASAPEFDEKYADGNGAIA
jgi:hypothetical protein